MNGLKRNITQKVNSMLEHFPAVVILGARQVGKTTLAKELRPNWSYIDLEKPSDNQLFMNDPEFFFAQNPRNIILDEAQTLPVLFNILRGVIDENRAEKNRFILTGSSSPELMNHISESLAGRIAIVELGTFKANEIAQIPLSPFYQLFQNNLAKEYLPSEAPPLTRQQVHHAWMKGGYPEPTLINSSLLYQEWMENYYKTYISRDIANLFPRLNKIAYQRFISILGKLSGTIINKSELARAIEINEKSVREYLNIAEGTFLWRHLLSFENNVIKSVIKMPKGHIQDSGLLHYLLKINSLDELYHHPIIGNSFEGFVIEELIKGLQAIPVYNWQSYYYRTRSGAEIDLILDGAFGILPIEIKYGSKVEFRKLKSLANFIEEHKAPFGLLINQADTAKWLTPTIYQLPVEWL